MSTSLGRRLKIRSLVYLAGEPIPHFWPMRAFIHHNPLHGYEHLPFEQAVREGMRLFHARVFLRRQQYQRLAAQGLVDEPTLQQASRQLLDDNSPVQGYDLAHWVHADLTRMVTPLISEAQQPLLADHRDVHAALQHQPAPARQTMDDEALRTLLRQRFLQGMPLYQALDTLFGTDLGVEVDELMIRSCLDFFDEGQSVWNMPNREQGFFQAWKRLSLHNGRLFLRGLHLESVMAGAQTPEQAILHVLEQLAIPETAWLAYLQQEIARLPGWAGFIRWRSGSEHYHWAHAYPADLVDFVAIRLLFASALLQEVRKLPRTRAQLQAWIDRQPKSAFLHAELHGGQPVPGLACELEQTLALNQPASMDAFFHHYMEQKRRQQAEQMARHIQALARQLPEPADAGSMNPTEVETLLPALLKLCEHEGMIWLRAMEARATGHLIAGVQRQHDAPETDNRPFAQALFCIDTRSERIRRALEQAGDYQTFGIAGFFGVPLGFIGLGKGSETHLCPVLLSPRNLVLELPGFEYRPAEAVTALGKVVHELKESILTPFVTVEAIGLLFGFDMVGKTLAPSLYTPWRARLQPEKGVTRLLVDKLSQERADSIVRAVQRAVIERALQQELDLTRERLTDDVIRHLREAALGHEDPDPQHAQSLGLDTPGLVALIRKLQRDYGIDRAFARLQMERLGRVGFTHEEQAGYVATALRSIGMTANFSRFVLLVGHGSSSENNPYESALDCGACGGNHGLVNARVLAQMANNPQVRERLRQQGIHIPHDTWFLPALHDTTTDRIRLADTELIPASHLIYIERLNQGLAAASRLCAAERMPTLDASIQTGDADRAWRMAQRNACDWSQVRPEWGLSGNAYFIIGRRTLTRQFNLAGRAFLHSYDWRKDPRRRLLENILTGPLVVGQWINMEHYFSTVDNERFGSGSKVYHNVAGRFGVMTGNLSDLRTGLPAQTVLKQGHPYHQPLRLITLVEAPLEHARLALEEVASVKRLVQNEWIRFLVLDPETGETRIWHGGQWLPCPGPECGTTSNPAERTTP